MVSTVDDGDSKFSYFRLRISPVRSPVRLLPPIFFPAIQGQPHSPISIINDSTTKPFLSRTVSSMDIPPYIYENENFVFPDEQKHGESSKLSNSNPLFEILRAARYGNRQMKRLFLMISLNVAYSTTELGIGLSTWRVGKSHSFLCTFVVLLVSLVGFVKFVTICVCGAFFDRIDIGAFHLTFGCGLLTFSLFAMVVSRRKPDHVFTYGYKRVEVLAAFTNALFLLFMSFSLLVEALHAFIQDESEHKHYLIVSAVTNLLVNLFSVWCFRNYARINLGLVLLIVVLPFFTVPLYFSGYLVLSWFSFILLQMAPPNVSSSALSKCLRQVISREDVADVSQARFWELVPGHVVGSLTLQVKKGMDDHPALQYIHGLYHDLGIQDLTVQTDFN